MNLYKRSSGSGKLFSLRELIARNFLILTTILSLCLSQMGGAQTALAASYTATWDSQSDFQNGCTGNGCMATSTVGSFVDTTTTPGSVQLAATGGSDTETFSGTNGTNFHLDLSTTTATTTSGTLARWTTPQFYNWSSKIAAMSTNFLRYMAYDSNTKNLYFLETPGKLSTVPPYTFTSLGGLTHVPGYPIAMDITSDDYKYITAGCGTAGTSLTQVNPSDTASTFISNSWNMFDCSVFRATYDSANGKEYYLATSTNPSQMGIYSYTSAGVSALAYASSTLAQTVLYYNPVTNKILLYDYPTSPNTIYSLDPSTGTISVFSNTMYVTGNGAFPTTIGIDDSGTAYIYENNGPYSAGSLAIYAANGTASKQTLSFAAGDAPASGNGTVFDHESEMVYGIAPYGQLSGTTNGAAYSYGPTNGSPTLTNLTSQLLTAWGNPTLQDVSIATDNNGTVWWAGSNASGNVYLAMMQTPPYAQYAVSNTLATVSAGIQNATLTATATPGTGTISYYLSNNGGSTWESATSGSAHTFSSPSGTQLKYKVVLTGNATVSSLTIAYNNQNITGTLGNLKLDATGDAAMVALHWNATIPANTQLEFRTRGATQAQGKDALYAAAWSPYTVATTTGASGAAILPNTGDSSAIYRYLEIQATLVSNNGVSSPILNSLGVTYAINAPPQFNQDYPSSSAGGSQASQISDSTDPNWGKVRVDYALEDSDTSTGTVNPGQFQASFEYRLNSADPWHTISPTYLSAGATGLQNILSSSYTTYTAYWNAAVAIPNEYSATAQIRVTANDNEAANSIATSTTAAFTLDTTPPSISAMHIDGSSSTSTISLSASDNTAFKDYVLTNNASGTPDGVNVSSGVWQAASSSSLTLNLPWTLDSGTSTHSAYVALRDIYDNVSSTSAVSPITPSDFELHDISNSASQSYKFIVAWTPYTSAPGATFDRYELWRSTDGTNYSLLQTVTDPALNYFLDTTVASSSTYYYKLRTIDTDGDSSAFTITEHAQPQGTGGSSLPPVISTVAITNVKNSSAHITWTTNTLSDSTVYYGTSNAYGSTLNVPTYTVNHAVDLTDLAPNTTYYVKVSSTDFYSNNATDDNSGASYTFTTVTGPSITSVTANSITPNSAVINWGTNASSDSEVYYSTSPTMSDPSQAGDSTLVASSTGGVYSHQVSLTDLSMQATYYFYVTSTDADGNSTTADNGGTYYSFSTIRDTTPPVISSISEPAIDSDTAVVTWQTDKASDSQVEWGTTASTSDGSYENSSTLDATLNTYHLVVLTGLTASTPYYFRVRSSDSLGNAAFSDEETFTTPDAGKAIVIIESGGGSSNTQSTVAPTISSTSVDPIDSFDATVNVNTDQSTRAVVEYGEVSSTTPDATFTGSAGASDLDTTQSIKLSGLTPGTTYHYIVTVINSDGLTTQSHDETFTTKFLAEDLGDLSVLSRAQDLQGQLEDILESALPSLSPPFMSTPVVASTTENSATITWGTNIPAYTVLDYSTDAQYASSSSAYATEISDIKTATTTHSVTITGLAPETTYHYSTHAFVFPQVVAKSADYTFATEASPVTPQVLNLTPNGFDIGWTTDTQTTSVVAYTDEASGTTQSLEDTALNTQHFASLQNLQSGHTYSVLAYGDDADGNRVGADAPLTVTVPVDTVAPQITALRIDSNLVPDRTDIIQSIVSWQTDKPSDSTVYYEEGASSSDAPLSNKVENDTGFVQDHVVILPNLKPSTIYRIQVSSTDQAGNTVLLPVRTIVTPQQTESIIDIIFKNFSNTFNFIH